MRQLILKVQSFLILLVLVSANVQAQKSPVDMDRFIDDLMKRMTLEEKIGDRKSTRLNSSHPSSSRMPSSA